MTRPPDAPVNLCDSCRHMRRVTSARGSLFLMCERSRTDTRYPRYPRLPVLRCEGYERGDAAAASTTLPPS